MKRGRPPQRRSAVRLITGGELPVRRNYEAIVFEHDADVITVLFERLAADRGLVGLREAPAFEAAVAAVGPVAARTDSRYVRALSPVHPGGRLRNRSPPQ